MLPLFCARIRTLCLRKTHPKPMNPKSNPPSKWGEGIGGPVQSCPDPNRPSFDQSEAEGIDSIIRTMLETQTRFLSKWESEFLTSVYGNRLSFKQRKTVFSIKKKIEEREAAERGSIDSTNKPGQ